MAIAAGSIVSDYELPVLCATATAQEFNIMSDPKITKIIEEDNMAYRDFCKIIDLAKEFPKLCPALLVDSAYTVYQ